jgi:hypothetical protein
VTTQTRESRYYAFCKELTELCRRHGVTICGYEWDSFGVKDIEERGSPFWYNPEIIDNLHETPSKIAIEWMERQRQADAEKVKTK